jgi:hypothetical protein
MVEQRRNIPVYTQFGIQSRRHDYIAKGQALLPQFPSCSEIDSDHIDSLSDKTAHQDATEGSVSMAIQNERFHGVLTRQRSFVRSVGILQLVRS